MVLSASDAHVGNIARATPIQNFTLRSGRGPVADPTDLAQRRQRDRWRSEVSVLRDRLRSALITAMVMLLLMGLTAGLASRRAPMAAVIPVVLLGPVLLWSVWRVLASWWRGRSLQRWLHCGREHGAAPRYLGHKGGWAWEKLPRGLRQLICAFLVIGMPALGCWMGIAGWHTAKGGPGGFMAAIACFGLPGLFLGLAMWPRRGHRT